MADSSTNPSFPPLYQSLATVNVGNFVTIKLTGDKKSTNYPSWKLQLLSLIESHDLISFIDGTIQPPDLQRDPTTAPAAEGGGRGSPEAYDIWRTDKVLRGWILGTISEPRVLAFAAKLDTAQKVWLALERTFEPRDSDPADQAPPAHPPVAQRDFFNVQIPLLKAALAGNWEQAQPIVNADRSAARIWIDDDNILTPLEVAVGTGKALHFVENLLEWIPDDESMALKNDNGSTALHIAAAVGNKAAATLLVGRMANLCYIPDYSGDFPIQYAAQYAKRNMLEYLISVTRDEVNSTPYDGLAGLRLLTYSVDAEFFDIALYLVDKYPYLAELKFPNGESALVHITGRSVLFNRKRFNFWERFISSRIIPKTTTWTSHVTITSNGENDDIESLSITRNGTNRRPQVFQNLNTGSGLCKILENLVPQIRTIKEKAMANDQALKLVKLICNKLQLLGNFKEARDIYEKAILRAAELGVGDVVEIIMDVFPLSIYAYSLPSNQYIFHEAVENRAEDVFNLIYQMSDHRHLFSNMVDANYNNLLHLAGKLAPDHLLNHISGAALQMQREIQWYKEVEKFVHPSTRERRNRAGKTPQMVFTDEHKKLKEDGEKWMKDTANSCTISAALIVTVMFAAAITVPGGNMSETGFPVFSEEPAFIVFAVSDAISLFTSATSLLLFLSILTSRYAEEDFLRVLPKRLIFGLATLFLSITFMIVAFSATLFLVFGKNQHLWVLAPVLISACLPVASFVLLQFPLLIDLISSTYGTGIFGKKSNRPFY